MKKIFPKNIMYFFNFGIVRNFSRFLSFHKPKENQKPYHTYRLQKNFLIKFIKSNISLFLENTLLYINLFLTCIPKTSLRRAATKF